MKAGFTKALAFHETTINIQLDRMKRECFRVTGRVLLKILEEKAKQKKKQEEAPSC
jgi:hypothetical protein